MTGSAPTHEASSAERVAHTPFVYRLEQFGLIIVWLLLIAVFGYLRPDTLLTWPNLSTILGSQAVLVVVTLGLIIPLTANDFDLSIAFVIVSVGILVLRVREPYRNIAFKASRQLICARTKLLRTETNTSSLP